MSAEIRYRRALRWYPKGWRDARGDEMLGALLDAADAAGRTSPTAAERLDLALHGTRERLRAIGGSVPSAVRDRAAAISLATGAMFAVFMTFTVEWAQWRNHGVELLPTVATFGPFASPAIILYAAWIVAFVLGMLGLGRATRIVVALTIPIAIAVRIGGDAAELWRRPSWTTLGMFIVFALIALIGRAGATRRSTGWLAIAAVVALGVFTSSLVLRPGVLPVNEPLFFGWPFDGPIAFSPAVAVGLAAILRAIPRLRPWSGAVLITAIPWACLAVFGGGAVDLDATLLVLAFLLALALLVATLRAFGLRLRLQRVPGRNP